MAFFLDLMEPSVNPAMTLYLSAVTKKNSFLAQSFELLVYNK